MGDFVMAYKGVVYLALVALLLCGGCGLKEGVVQKAPKSFLWFTGDIDNATVYIDDLAPITLQNHIAAASDEDNNTNRTSQVHYEISPGKHSIVIRKSGEVIVDRSVLLGNGITKEIQIP